MSIDAMLVICDSRNSYETVRKKKITSVFLHSTVFEHRNRLYTITYKVYIVYVYLYISLRRIRYIDYTDENKVKTK